MMTHDIAKIRALPLALTIAAAFAASLARPVPASAQQVRIDAGPAALADARGVGEVRRRIAAAASALCETGGVAALYRNGADRCRAAVIADGERQLARRLTVRTASR